MIRYEVRCDECYEIICCESKLRNAKHYAANVNGVKVNDRYYCEDCAIRNGYLVECTGEAHSNPYIDNCAECAPRWGYVRSNKDDTRNTTMG